MRITSKIDYAVRLAAELAAAYPSGDWVKADDLARAQDVPAQYVLGLVNTLKQAGLVVTHRGAGGGAKLALPPDRVPVADVIRAIDGPLASVGGTHVEDVEYRGSAVAVRDVWVGLRAAMRSVLDTVSLADVVAGELPPSVAGLIADDDAWRTRPNRRDTRPRGASSDSVTSA
ncbi:RrF2 family transcriptional regulator [Luteimicrobium subarcticum]|uniref:BadM/Rrf2 family transcriptional regulator n=1 Tax=Luteimicrobium subarcticum TaxID=620910 RepID=A0A2M8WJ03_9MICO|nr:Rrf2 family transcriptional regulator [Luteimicrobium subarcticum]PJI90914.1 BadM/Rrf2 family transcriptional regulator [Luteimicrobium subarcticum]